MQIDRVVLSRLVPETLEKSAFLLAQPLPAPPLSIESPLLEAQISFSGPASGELTLLCADTFCRCAAASMLGLDEDEVEQPQMEDALTELANVLCGQLLTAFAGSEPIFNLTTPRLLHKEDSQWTILAADPNVLAFQAEGQPLLVKIELKESA